MKFTLLTVIFFLQSAYAFTQRSRYALTEQEQKYLTTLKALARTMRSGPVPTFTMGDSSSANSKTYDDLIVMYFNYPRMVRLFSRDTAVFNVETKLYLLKSVLAACNRWVHLVPADSIFIRPPHVLEDSKHARSAAAGNRDEDRLEIYLRVNGRSITVLSCLFHRQTAKLLAIDPVTIAPDESKLLNKVLREEGQN
jgi:hypothetical protein